MSKERELLLNWRNNFFQLTEKKNNGILGVNVYVLKAPMCNCVAKSEPRLRHTWQNVWNVGEGLVFAVFVVVTK